MANIVDVLIVEDRPSDAELMVLELERGGFEPHWARVDTEQDYVAHLGPDVDLILADHSLPEFGSRRALSLLRERGLDTPFIVVTGSLGEEKAVELIREGASDYLLKDRLTRLGEAARRVLDEKKLRDDRRHAESTLAWQNQRLTALYRIGKAVNSTLNIDEILDYVADEAMRVTSAQRGQVLTVDAGRGVFERRSQRGFTPEELKRARRQPLGLDHGINGQVYQSPQIVRVDDVRTRPDYFPLIRSTRSELVVPILREGRLLGNIDLQAEEVGAFRDVDVDYLQALAEQAALAITNARLYQELATYNEVLAQAVAERTSELQATKDRIETIFASVGDALLVLRTNGCIEQVNLAFERQTGFSAAEIESRDHYDLLGLAFASPDEYRAMLKALAPGQVWHGEAAVHRKDGSTYDAALTMAPVPDTEGAVRLLVASIRDITPLKEVERAKDRFVSNVSHELQTPITSIKLNAKLLSQFPDRTETYVGRVQRETDRLHRIIEHLLTLSRLEQGSIDLEFDLLDINELAAEYVMDRRPLADSHELELTIQQQPRLPFVRADRGLVGQVLSILLTNAFNYTPAGGQVVVQTRGRRLAAKQWVGLSVSDTGPGISPDDQSHLFERFFRGRAGRDSGRPGTGLGLSIVRTVVDRHHGQVEVHSEGIPGKGTTFIIWLPAEDLPS